MIRFNSKRILDPTLPAPSPAEISQVSPWGPFIQTMAARGAPQPGLAYMGTDNRCIGGQPAGQPGPGPSSGTRHRDQPRQATPVNVVTQADAGPVYFGASSPPGYKLRLGDLPPDISAGEVWGAL